jgi:small membrane protein
MPLIQILIVGFALYALSRAVLRFRAGELHLAETAVWALFWAGVIVVAVRPETSSRAAELLGVGRGADLVVYLSVIALFWLVFRLFVRIERMERSITRLIREIGLKDAGLNDPRT